MTRTATAQAHANIAFIKYWGNKDEQLRLPANPSLSMNLDGLTSKTSVAWRSDLKQDELILNGGTAPEPARDRVSKHLDALRQRLQLQEHAEVISSNNFPMGAGIASSASAFAALTVAATAAAGQSISERELTTLARLGSGSASRSIPTGFVEWHAATTHEGSYAETVFQSDYWDIVDIIAVVSHEHKAVVSREGHQSANTSDLQTARVAGAAKRLEVCKLAIRERDFHTFASVVEHDSNLMHAIMMTSQPPLFYWLPATLTIMQVIRQWRVEGLQVCYTLDAGPNVHCLCLKHDVDEVSQRLQKLSGIEGVLRASAGHGATIVKGSQISAS
jgi:diphosphomevalonate decarboxylase